MELVSTIQFTLNFVTRTSCTCSCWTATLDDKVWDYTVKSKSIVKTFGALLILYLVISNMPGVAFRTIFSPPWRTLFISDAVERVTGWPARDFMEGRIHLGDLVHPGDAARIDAQLDEALRKQRPYHCEYRFIHRDGRERWVSETGR